MQKDLFDFLEKELAIPSESIAFAARDRTGEPTEANYPVLTHIPMVLWQYGLVNSKQLDKIFDWLERV